MDRPHYTPHANAIMDVLLTDTQKTCAHPSVTPIEPWDGSSLAYHHYQCDVCRLMWRNERFFRIFQGMSTWQVDGVTGAEAQPTLWYWEPRDYTGDVLWSQPFATPDEAIDDAIGNMPEE